MSLCDKPTFVSGKHGAGIVVDNHAISPESDDEAGGGARHVVEDVEGVGLTIHHMQESLLRRSPLLDFFDKPPPSL